MTNKKFFLLTFCLLIIVFSGCSGNKVPTNGEQYYDPLDLIFDPSLGDGEILFESPVLPIDQLDYIIPLGSLSPHEHTFPTQHIYWVETESETPSEVSAPAGGKILEIKEFGDQDHGIMIGVTNTMTYYIYHLNLDAGYQVGTRSLPPINWG